jgi:hypothetical protein
MIIIVRLQCASIYGYMLGYMMTGCRAERVQHKCDHTLATAVHQCSFHYCSFHMTVLALCAFAYQVTR